MTTKIVSRMRSDLCCEGKEFRISGLNTGLRANRQNMSCLVAGEDANKDGIVMEEERGRGTNNATDSFFTSSVPEAVTV